MIGNVGRTEDGMDTRGKNRDVSYFLRFQTSLCCGLYYSFIYCYLFIYLYFFGVKPEKRKVASRLLVKGEER